MDASEYKHVVLGLIFLKYVEDAFEERRGSLRAELAAEGLTGEAAEELLESRDEYTAEGVFWVPPEACACRKSHPRHATRRYSLIRPPT